MSILSNDIKALHSSCFFEKCSKTGNGGAVFLKCSSSIIQHRFCATNISSTKSGMYSAINLLNNNENHKNLIIESSVSNCNKTNNNCGIYSEYGKCGIFASNITKNELVYYPGFYMKNVKDVAVINYTNIEGNYARVFVCLAHMASPEGSFLDYRCNIIKNSQGRDDFGTICSQDDVVVEECTVLGPYEAGKPFSQCDPGGGNLNIINCYVDKMEVKSTIGGTIITRGNKITSKLNALSEIKLNCVAILPKNKGIKTEVFRFDTEESIKVLNLLMVSFGYQH